ncbi:MAG: Hsp20/alpha crystallin family protein [Flavobacteriaceae bacterium]|nr:Hsp20/alpha crystallin family protein [Flavobacteriaceae bacterium]
MTVTKFRKRRRPFGKLATPEFFDFDMEDFFENRLRGHRFFNDRFWNGKANEPALNIKETDEFFDIELAAPGFDKEDFKVTVEDGYLNIRAEKTLSKEEKEEEYTRREFSYNSFERGLPLPENVEDEEIAAKYKNGILRFKLMKKEIEEKTKAKVIEISS